MPNSERCVLQGRDAEPAGPRNVPHPRDAVDYIMDTFPIVRRKDEGKYDGDYRTKRTILKIYDAMANWDQSNWPHTSAHPEKRR